MRYFIRAKGKEGYIEANTLENAFIEFVKRVDLEDLGMIIYGHTEYFPSANMPEDTIPIRVTLPLVKAGIFTEEEAMDCNEAFCGERFV